MNIFNVIKDNIIKIVEDVFDLSHQADFMLSVTVELPREAKHGDLSTNVALVLAKPLGQSPRQLAETLAPFMRSMPFVTSIEIAGPGFINIRLQELFWQKQLLVILAEGVHYGDGQSGAHIQTNIEYVSANPTGPMHIGHARGAVLGDALALLLKKAGYEVKKEYYINDAGNQIDSLTRSVHWRYREACGETIGEIPAGLYPGEYLVPVGKALRERFGPSLLKDSEEEWLSDIRVLAVEAMMALIRADLADLGIHHDIFSSEKTLQQAGQIEAGLKRLTEYGALYRGVLEPPKGKTPDDWEAKEQTLFRSTDYGDDSDRPLIKSNGSYTYFAGDVAYTADKIARGFSRLIMVLGADHGGYVGRMKALVEVLGEGKASIEIVLCQLVKLFENGEPFKMSKRAGTFITVRDVLDALGKDGKDILRFVMLTRKPEQMLDFDLAKVKEQSKDNPVFYVQYAHARCQSLLRLATSQMPESVAASEHPGEALARLMHPAEIALLRRLCYWPRLVESAAEAGEPHRVAYYLQEVAAEFHGVWNLGNDDPGLRFILPDDAPLTTARLALARGVAIVIASGLAVLGVAPADEMR